MSAEERDKARRPRRILRWRNFWIALALAAVGVTAYSLYVGLWYYPDAQDTVVLGQSSLYSDSPGSLRVLVRDQRTGRPVRNASVRISLEGAGGRAELGTFTTDKEGTFSDQFVVPALPPGSYTLTVAVRSGIGKDTIAREVQLKRPCRLYLTTDKPIYQPGQTLHMRAMVLNRETLSPFAGRPAVFEVQDPKGNKVYKAACSTSAYGIASADFEIADSVNLGRYRASVLAEGVAGEKTVTVQRYVLPKFRVRVATDSAWHLPAETLSGTVSASYFFGKPVAGAQVEVVGSTVVEQPVEVLKLAGQTDDAGVMSFSFSLPRHFIGVHLAGRDAFLELQATVTDSAGHAERSAAHLTVAADPIKVQVLPEGGEPVPGVQNLIYILSTYPDGTPAECRVEAEGARLDTDASGLAVLRVTPVRGTWTLRGVARDRAGRVTAFERLFSAKPAVEAPIAQRADTAGDIFEAARTGNVSRVRYLLRQDPKLANARKHGVPLLHYAAEAAEPKVVGLLLSKGADVHAVEDVSGRTCPHRIAGAYSASRIGRAGEVLHLLTAAGADLNARDAYGRTPLFAAAGVEPSTELGPPYGQGADVRVMSMLLEAGADPNAQDEDGDAVLHYAAGWATQLRAKR